MDTDETAIQELSRQHQEERKRLNLLWLYENLSDEEVSEFVQDLIRALTSDALAALLQTHGLRLYRSFLFSRVWRDLVAPDADKFARDLGIDTHGRSPEALQDDVMRALEALGMPASVGLIRKWAFPDDLPGLGLA